jgi:hypothetical protein
MDDAPGSPYYGRMYSAWVNFVSPYPVLISYSADSGKSWSTPAAVNTTPPARCSGGYVKTGGDGKVYVCWAGLPDVGPFLEDFVGFAVSTNGGVDWSINQNAFDMNGVNGILSAKSNIRINGLPHLDVDKSNGPRKGWIYIITTEKDLSPAGGDHEIILHRSTDDGQTWSGGIRVNQDALNNGKIQYFPAIHVDSGGAINIIYYDDRNTSSDSAEILLSRSVDGGATWSERIISDHRCKPKPIPGGSAGYQGDHISLTSVGERLYAFWMDDFSGTYQVWSTMITISSLGVKNTDDVLPATFELEQNFPNPFNPSTIINYRLQRKSNVILSVYTMTGELVSTLAEGIRDAGDYSVRWTAVNRASGIYFCRLRAIDPSGASFTAVRKMLFLR